VRKAALASSFGAASNSRTANTNDTDPHDGKARRKAPRDCKHCKAGYLEWLSLSLRCRDGECVRLQDLTIASKTETVRCAFASRQNKRIAPPKHLNAFVASEVVHQQSKNAISAAVTLASEFEVGRAIADVDSESYEATSLSGGAVSAVDHSSRTPSERDRLSASAGGQSQEYLPPAFAGAADIRAAARTALRGVTSHAILFP
jgi:hypothetical protein